MDTELEASDVEAEFCAGYAPDIYDAILDILTKMSVDADVSYRVTEEVVIHFWRDMRRLYAIHHELVHVTKSCSYLAFWVRKLKPISGAVPNEAVRALQGGVAPPLYAEITDINEQVAIHLAVRLLRNCIRDQSGIRVEGLETAQLLCLFDEVVADYLESKIEDGMSMGLRFQSMVYDMRFRTYGPHHLTHVLTHIIRDLYRECKASTKS